MNISFTGYYPSPKILPETSGIYIVLACRQLYSLRIVNFARIIYIGKSDNIHDTLYPIGAPTEELYKEFQSQCEPNERIFYCCAALKQSELEKVEAALITIQQPPLNEPVEYQFPSETFHLEGTGADDFKMADFTL